MSQETAQLLDNDVENEIAYSNTERSEPTVPAKKFPQYLAAITASLCALSAGLTLGWTSPIMDDLENGALNHLVVDKNKMGWVGSFAILGAMTMCIPTGFLCDKIGRKLTLLCITIPLVTGWLLVLFAQSFFILYLGRLISGMGFGACIIAVPIYISEISETSLRGTLGSYTQIMISMGVLVAYFIGSLLNIKNFTIACIVIPLIFACLFVFQPESPVYLLKKGLVDEAECNLIRLRGTEYDFNNELHHISESLKEDGNSVSLAHAFNRKSNVKAFMISMFLMFSQQFSGINTVILYTTQIFHLSGLKLNNYLATVIIGLVQVIATFAASFVVDSIGRRPLLITSAFFGGLSTCTLAFYITLKTRISLDSSILSYFGSIPIVSLGIFIVMFSIGLGPLPFVVSSEIFSPEIKSTACAAAGTFNQFLAFLITKSFLDISEVVGEDTTFYLFSICSIMSSVLFYFIIPETKGKTIDEIQWELGLLAD